MAGTPKLQKYMRDRADYFDTLSQSELKSYEETQKERQEILSKVTDTKNALTSEINEFERTHTSFFAVAISLIIAGMLSNQPARDATHAAQVFYFTSVAAASLTGMLLFLEFSTTKKAFKRWLDHAQQVADYTNSKEWTPDTFRAWVEKHNANAEKHTPNIFFIAEIALLSLSLAFLLCWLFETLFNPNWPLF